MERDRMALHSFYRGVAVQAGCRSRGSCEPGGSEEHGPHSTAAFAPAGAPTGASRSGGDVGAAAAANPAAPRSAARSPPPHSRLPALLHEPSRSGGDVGAAAAANPAAPRRTARIPPPHSRLPALLHEPSRSGRDVGAAAGANFPNRATARLGCNASTTPTTREQATDAG